MNKIVIVGNLSTDPDYQVSASGTPVCRFSVAVNRRFKRECEPDVDFFRVVTFDKAAENCANYLTKGKKAAVSGEIHFGQYTDKDGVKRQSTDLIAYEVEFLSPKTDYSANQQPTATKPAPTAPKAKQTSMLEVVNDDSLPF